MGSSLSVTFLILAQNNIPLISPINYIPHYFEQDYRSDKMYLFVIEFVIVKVR